VSLQTIYPTCIIFLVILEKKHFAGETTVLMGSASGVPMPPVITIGTMVYADPGHVVTLGLSEESGSAMSGSREELEQAANDNILNDKEQTGNVKFAQVI
jgi:hypothetical protein